MSALDRAFTKAYAKDATPNSPPRSGAASEVARPAASPYDTGPLYRLDFEPPAAEQVVPAPHQKFARTGNSLRSRYTTVQPEVDLPEPVAPIPQLSPVVRLLADERPMLREFAPVAPLPPPRPVAPLPPLPPPPVVERVVEQRVEKRVEQPAPFRTQGLDLVARRLAGSSDSAVDPSIVVEEPFLRSQPTAFVETVSADVTSAPGFTPPVTVMAPSHFATAPSILIFTPALDLAAHQPQSPPPEPVLEPTPPKAEVAPEPTLRLDSPAVLQGPHFKLKPQAEKPVEAPIEKPVEKPAPIETPVVAGPPAPAWEVDAFQWPEVCQRLLSDSSSYFAQAGAKLQAAVRDGLHTLAVAGSARGEGASTLALSLAKAAVQAGLKVALVDADFVDPQLATRLGLDIDAGWQSAANGHVPLHEVAVLSLTDKLTFYPLQKNADLSLNDPWAVATLRKIQESFDLVLVDLGPIAAGDAPLFAKDEPPPFDAVVIVRDVRRTPLDHAQAVAGRLYAAGIEAVGIAENFVS